MSELQSAFTPSSELRQHHTYVLIPAFNEERFIGSLILSTRPYANHVVVIDDGSSDRTVEIAQMAGALVIRHERNQGKAAAVNTGLEYLRPMLPAVVVLMDGDGQHHPEDIPTLINPVLTGEADIVIGSRFREIKSDIPVYRQVGQHGLSVVTAMTSGVWSSDSQSGFRALSAHALDCLHFSQSGFSIESEMQFLARDHHLRVLEAPIKVTYAEPAKRNPVRHASQVMNGILKLVGQSRPLLFFSSLGIIMLVASAFLGVSQINIYLQSRMLQPEFIALAILLTTSGIIMVFAGVILHSIRAWFINLQQLLLSQSNRQSNNADSTVF